jgi:hypothetical protein
LFPITATSSYGSLALMVLRRSNRLRPSRDDESMTARSKIKSRVTFEEAADEYVARGLSRAEDDREMWRALDC